MRVDRMHQAERLTRHFTVRELTNSQTGTRRGIDNTPDAEQLIQLLRLAKMLEAIRAYIGVAIFISSGFRSWLVNRAVGGSWKSVHMTGRAADISAPGIGAAYELARLIIESDIPFDRMIFEGTWVHIEVAPEGGTPRRQVMTAEFRPFRKTKYHAGLIHPADLEKAA